MIHIAAIPAPWSSSGSLANILLQSSHQPQLNPFGNFPSQLRQQVADSDLAYLLRSDDSTTKSTNQVSSLHSPHIVLLPFPSSLLPRPPAHLSIDVWLGATRLSFHPAHSLLHPNSHINQCVSAMIGTCRTAMTSLFSMPSAGGAMIARRVESMLMISLQPMDDRTSPKP